MPFFLYLIFAVLTGLTIWFIVAFFWPSILLGRVLSPLPAALKGLSKGDLDGIRTLFAAQRDLQEFWPQYEETLHKQYEFIAGDSTRRCVSIRATLPAEAFFNAQNIIEPYVKSELFKHFPGIYTGIGILGTFGGLITGLRPFDPTGAPDAVTKAIKALLEVVSDAFVVSAVAIGLAMLLTFVEKLRIERLVATLQKICQEIDRHFMAGVLEEYLERLVTSSEESATQTKILKDSLVVDLRQILEDVTERQIQANAGSPAQIGNHFRDAIITNLAEPLNEIKAGLSNERKASGDVLTAALGDVLAAFSENLKDMFGGNVKDIAALQKETINSLIGVVEELKTLVAGINQAGKDATEGMGTRLIEALETMSERQKIIDGDMKAFVHGIQKIVADSQTESANGLQKMLTDLGGQMAGIVTTLRSQAELATQAHRDQQAVLTKTTGDAVTGIGDAVNGISTTLSTSLEAMKTALSDLIADTSSKAKLRAEEGDKRQQDLLTHTDKTLDGQRKQMQTILESMATDIGGMALKVEGMFATNQKAFLSSIKSMEAMLSALNDSGERSAKRLNLSVDNLAIASGDFANAGKGVNLALQEASELARILEEAARGLDRSSGTVTKIVDDHAQARNTLRDMISSLQLVVDSARKEASLTAEALKAIKLSADKLSTAHRDVDGYVDRVSNGLVKIGGEFTAELVKIIRGGNTEYLTHLTAAVGALREGIEELEVTLGKNGASSPGKR